METVEQLVTFNHIHAELNGGAPWGFTLKGGLEHGEPLIITKIEEGGKAAECKKLRVGDELVNINGSALFGSRQEALILIKGSYRVLKIVVRRRTVPLTHPHSWHLVKLSDAPSVPGAAGSSEGPLAMQLHPTPFSVPWQSGGDSELSVPLGHLSRHYSTDRSSSVGSMESLENPPSQGYYDSQLSPIDPAIFNNKRDSAYSSFSASSNTSDYTVSLRPEENSSMDSLLQGFGPSCRFTEGHSHSATSGPGELHCEEGVLKSRSMPHRPVAKARPSSYSYEEDKRGPPQPPMRKDSFRATRGLPEVLDKRCASAPVESQLQEKGFDIISAASSMDTLLENQEQGESKGDDGDISKPSQKRQFRSSKSRRRSERFATNLRNEIQRKKAQLHKSKGSGDLLCDGETLEEEDMEEKSPSAVPAIHQHRTQTQTSQHNSSQNFGPSQARTVALNSTFPGRCCGTNSAEHSGSRSEAIHLSQEESHGIQSAEVNRPVCVRVVEELAPPGKARRWRWTPQHKLQLEMEQTEMKKNGEGVVPSSSNLVKTTRGRVGSSGGRSARADESDILPFADRRKFFEETSRNLSQSVTNLAALTSHRQRSEKHGRMKGPTSPEPLESVPDLGRRRFSYQGGINDGNS
ncbi:protein Shroom4 isoform X1, partial [Clarias magur]